MAYRTRKPSAVDMESDALADLVGRMRALRRRVALPFLIAAAVAGHAGMILHALGHWSVIGELPGGGYMVNKLTVLLAFVIPALPIVLAGWPVYWLSRERVRRTWREEHGKLSPEWLAGTSKRYH